MSRPLRIEYPGAVYHVTSRGNARQAIFDDDTDRRTFLDLLGTLTDRFHWLCHAYCLMDNHYHVLIETPEANLSRGMRELNGRYTQTYNRRHHRVGRLMQGRYKAIVVDRDRYLLELCRYVVLNPVRARVVSRPEDYGWSSYPATCGKGQPLRWLHTAWILRQFAKTRPAAVRRYMAFVAEGTGAETPWKDLRGQVLLGGDAFLARIRQELSGAGELGEVPKTQRYAHRPALDTFFEAEEARMLPRRDEQIWRANREYGYSLSEIGRRLGLHYSTVSKAISRYERSRFKT